ncbi:MAG: hypothetical protein IH820_01470 [Bacteroidetes bacterium]|nr:hypothetical protein [Bacteroidota bacterium]
MTTKRTRFLALAAFLFVFAFAACDSSPSAIADEEATSAELSDLSARLSTDLGLSTEQAQEINNLFAVSGDEKPEPGHLWTVAAELQKTLTDEQKATFEEKRAERKARFGEHREAASEARNEALGLSADQEAALASMREAHQPERKALIEKIRAGDLDRETVKAEFEALREANKAALAEVLTPEQVEIAEIHNALAGGIALRRAGRRGPRGFGRPGN